MIFFISIGGLVFGSFLNVCIARIPKGESIVLPASHCPHCGHAIRWFDNVPLVSYVVLGGRCRDCREGISPLYPVVEAVTSVVLVAGFLVYGLNLAFLKYAVLAMLLIVLTFTDLLVRRLPHRVTIFGMAAGVLLSLFVPVPDFPFGWILSHFGVGLPWRLASLLASLGGALFGAGLFYAVGEIFARLRHKQGLGFGDVMLMGLIGTFLGVPLTYLTILLGSLAGTLVALSLYALNPRYRRDYPWPYGSFLALAGIYAALGGNTILGAYLRWSGL